MKFAATLALLLTVSPTLARLSQRPATPVGTHCTTTCTGFGNTRTCNTYCY